MAGNKQRIWENQVSNLDTDIYLNHTIKLACFRYAENNNHVFKTAYLYQLLLRCITKMTSGRQFAAATTLMDNGLINDHVW